MTFTDWLILNWHTRYTSKVIESLLSTIFYMKVKGVKVVSLREEFDLSTPVGKRCSL